MGMGKVVVSLRRHRRRRREVDDEESRGICHFGFSCRSM
jgi:hypothetical protein